MALTHTHLCQHCDSTWHCKLDCVFPRDVSKWHDCGERELDRRRLARITGDYQACQYGCATLPCIHDKWAGKQDTPGYKMADCVRPRIVAVQGIDIMLCNENSYSREQYEIYKEQRRNLLPVHEQVTTYVSDGRVEIARQAQRRWDNAKLERIADKYPSFLRDLIKEHRK